MFCACPTAPAEGEADEPNTRVCPICLGMPGTLPVINRRAVELVMLTGLALDCHVETDAVRFERKNYFYPDLPKGYQISQYALPLTSNGRLVVPVPSEGGEVTHRDHPRPPRGGHRAHAARRSRVQRRRLQPRGRAADGDRHRARPPLAGRRRAPTARRCASCCVPSAPRNADMEAGSMRIEGNVSLRPMGATSFGTKVEVKNLNSFRSLERAMEFEVARHAEALDRGETLSPGDAWLGRGATGGRSFSAARRRRTTTATSRSPICRRSARRTRGSRSCAAACPSCRRSAVRGTSTPWASPPTTPAC